MGRFTKVWTDTQRAAVTRAIVDHERRPHDVLADARAGELAGLPPFDMPLSTAQDYARKERRRREKATQTRSAIELENPEQAAQELRRRTLALAEGYLTRAETKLEAGKLEPKDFATTSAAVLDIAQRIERADAGAGARKPPLHEGNKGFLEQLATSDAVPSDNGAGDQGTKDNNAGSEAAAANNATAAADNGDLHERSGALKGSASSSSADSRDQDFPQS